LRRSESYLRFSGLPILHLENENSVQVLAEMDAHFLLQLPRVVDQKGGGSWRGLDHLNEQPAISRAGR
jgi:hypothetical protein